MPVSTDEYIRLQGETIKQLKQHLQFQDARILEQEQIIAELCALVDELRLLKTGMEETLEELRHKLFSTKSEKTKTASADAGKNTENTAVETTVECYADIPIRDVMIPVLDKERRCPYCNVEMALVGHKEVRTELRITPVKVERIRYMQEELI